MVFRSLGIVLPAYNEEARLGPALDELVGYLRAAPDGQLPACINVLVVDDGSTDGTADLVRARPEFAAAADVAFGSRIQPDGSDMRASQPRFRRLVGRLFRFAAQLWVTGPIRDTQCGFKGFRRESACDLFERLRITSIVFDADLIYLARRRGYRTAVVPVVWADRRGSRMNARPRLALRVAWDLIRIRFVHGRIERLRIEEPIESSPQP